MLKPFRHMRQQWFRALMAAIIIVMIGWVPPGVASQKEVVSIPTRSSVTLPFMLITPDNPVATVVLLEGGTGLVGFSGNTSQKQGRGRGGRKQQQKGGGFLARNADNFARHGLRVVLVDAPSDVGPKGMHPTTRMSTDYAQDFKHLVAFLRQKSEQPVWLIGISLGTYSAVNGAITLKDNIQGIIIASAPTRSEPNSQAARVSPDGILSMDLHEIIVPVLIVAHENDACYGTPASGALKIEARLLNAPEVDIQNFSGSSPARSDVCAAAAAHTFFGIDDQVVAAIAEFIM